MKRGGKRAGAGRPSRVDDSARLAIGAQVENLINLVSQKDASNRIKARRLKTAVSNPKLKLNEARAAALLERIDEIQTELESLDIAQRVQESKRIARGTSDRVGDVRSSIEALGGQFFHEPLKRPKGWRRAILDQVASWASDRYQVSVTSSFVEDCFKEYRTFLTELRSDAETELEFPPK